MTTSSFKTAHEDEEAWRFPQDLGQPLVLEDHIPVPQPITFTSPPLCATCHVVAATPQRCAGCKNIKYCSKDCQIADRPQHRLLCKAYLDFATSPGPTKRRALLFANRRVTFTWLDYANDGKPLDITNCFPGVPEEHIRTIGFHDRYLPYWIQLRYDIDPDGLSAGELPVSTRYNLKTPFSALRGPVVAIAYDPEDGLSAAARHLDTTALGPVLEYGKLRDEYNGPIFVEQPQERYTKKEAESLLCKTNEPPVRIDEAVDDDP